MRAPANRAITFFMMVPISLAVGEPISAITALHGGLDFGGADGLGKIAFDEDDLLQLLGGEFGTVALGECLGGLVALLDEGGEHLHLLLLVERRALVDFLVLEGGLDHAQSGEAQLLPGLHRLDDVFLNLGSNAHGFMIRPPSHTSSHICQLRQIWGTRGERSYCGAGALEAEGLAAGRRRESAVSLRIRFWKVMMPTR